MSSNEIENFTDTCKQMLQDEKNVDDVLLYLRTKSGSKIISGMVIANLLNISINEAIMKVHTSKVWDDVRKRDEDFQEIFISEIEKMNKKNNVHNEGLDD